MFLLYVVVCWILYYLFSVRAPRIVANSSLKTKLLEHCPTLSKQYWPSPFLPHPLLQEYALYHLECDLQYAREYIDVHDGESLALDWCNSVNGRATVLIVPGIMGSSEVTYIKYMSRDLQNADFDVVVLNRRGCTPKALKRSKFYHYYDTADLECALRHIHRYIDEALSVNQCVHVSVSS
jgi:predicted alpha/beta-fold hydrolase